MQAQLIVYGQLEGDPTAARASMERAAMAGDAEAAFVLGSWDDTGLGAAVDRQQALRWWRLAADGGHLDAAFNVGLLLLQIPGERYTALDYLRRAAAGNHALACYTLGTWLAENASDEIASIEALRCAAMQGYAPAQFNLGVRYLAAGNRAAATQWLEQAALTFAPAVTVLQTVNAAPTPAMPPISPEPTAQSAATPPSPHGAIHDRAWVLAQAPERFTVVISAATEATALEQMLLRHAETWAEDTDSAYFLHRPGSRQPYTAIVGSFASADDAVLARAALPPDLQRNRPWIRRYAALHRELAAAVSAPAAAKP